MSHLKRINWGYSPVFHSKKRQTLYLFYIKYKAIYLPSSAILNYLHYYIKKNNAPTNTHELQSRISFKFH